jgi:hypothetical protein
MNPSNNDFLAKDEDDERDMCHQSSEVHRALDYSEPLSDCTSTDNPPPQLSGTTEHMVQLKREQFVV